MTADADPPHALIISRNARTAKGLRSYFDGRGVASAVTDQLDALEKHDQFTAVVVFPDEFPAQSAPVAIGDLAHRFLRAWIVVVTRHPARFVKLMAATGAPNVSRLLVLPRPVWGWALLDRILQPAPADTDP